MRYKKLSDENRNPTRKLPAPPAGNRHSTAIVFLTPQRCQKIAFVFFALMLLIGAIPGEAAALSDAVGDKLLHLCAYSFLTCVLFGGLTGNSTGRVFRTIMMIGFLASLDEAIQSLMPYRNANFADWVFDLLAAGVTLGILVLLSSGTDAGPEVDHRSARPAERPN